MPRANHILIPLRSTVHSLPTILPAFPYPLQRGKVLSFQPRKIAGGPMMLRKPFLPGPLISFLNVKELLRIPGCLQKIEALRQTMSMRGQA